MTPCSISGSRGANYYYDSLSATCTRIPLSKALKAALKQMLVTVQSLSLVEESPTVDPNLAFLFLDDLRVYKKTLRVQSKLKKKGTAAEAKHLGMLRRRLRPDRKDLVSLA